MQTVKQLMKVSFLRKWHNTVIPLTVYTCSRAWGVSLHSSSIDRCTVYGWWWANWDWGLYVVHDGDNTNTSENNVIMNQYFTLHCYWLVFSIGWLVTWSECYTDCATHFNNIHQSYHIFGCSVSLWDMKHTSIIEICFNLPLELNHA